MKLFGTLLVSLSKGDEPRISFANKSIKISCFGIKRRGSRSCSDNQNEFSAFWISGEAASTCKIQHLSSLIRRKVTSSVYKPGWKISKRSEARKRLKEL